jgi:glycosyltransferase involved in cell wall biosynthesis
LKIIVDGIIYQLQWNGGISRIYNEVLPRMCNLDDSLNITLLTEGTLKQVLPVHTHIRHRSIPLVRQYLRPWRLWKPVIPQIREILLKFRVGDTNTKIWHSTFYTMLEGWNGLSVVMVYDMIHERFPTLFAQQSESQFRVRKKNCILAADALICISNATREDLQDFYGIDSNKIWVIPLAHSNTFNRMMDVDCDPLNKTTKPFFLYIGDRSHYKNFEGMLYTYSVWPGRNEVDIFVVGKPWSSSEEKRLRELGVEEQVSLFTEINDEDLCYLYNKAAAFIYPSLYEGFGIPLLEAMACGCPIIASRIPSTLEVAGECPIYFEPGETDSLLNAFISVLTESRNSDRVRMGLERTKDFSWNKTAAQTLQVYKAISTKGL